jgi:hypothetical protein
MYIPAKAVVSGPQEARYVETLGAVQNVFIHNLGGRLVAVRFLDLDLDLVPDLGLDLDLEDLDLDLEDPEGQEDLEDLEDPEGQEDLNLGPSNPRPVSKVKHHKYCFIFLLIPFIKTPNKKSP